MSDPSIVHYHLHKRILIRPAEALQTKTGDRDGQQLFIRENDNSVTAHLWSSSRRQWDLVSNPREDAPKMPH